jgi:hypothetical protein
VWGQNLPKGEESAKLFKKRNTRSLVEKPLELFGLTFLNPIGIGA